MKDIGIVDAPGRFVIPKEIGAHKAHPRGDLLLTTLKRSDMFAIGMMRLVKRMMLNCT